jgi:hypothetical protein
MLHQLQNQNKKENNTNYISYNITMHLLYLNQFTNREKNVVV